MKNIFYRFLIITVTLLSLGSCKEDIELSGEYEETAVVYGLLDQSDSVHMIKITRAFIGPGDALVFAKIPDSNYFKSVTGTITEYISGTQSRVFNLTDTTVLNKDPNGIFYAPTQKLYYFTTPSGLPLLENAEYRLSLNINNGAFNVTGKTNLISGITENISSKNQPFKFAQNDGTFISTTVSINSGNSYQINTTLIVEFTEWRGTSPTLKKFKWSLGENETNPNETFGFSAFGEKFFNLIKSNATTDNTITKRTFNSITTEVTGGSQSLFNYILVNKPSSTLSQSKPTFTNLEASNGKNVIGLFSARHKVSVFKPLVDPSGSLFVRCINIATTNKLCTGPVTGSLLFCSDHPADATKSWFCL